VVNLFIIAHDACHQSFTTSRTLNRVIGTIAMLPGFHAYSLWDHEHNRRHHRFNNVRALDHNWEPMTFEEYARAGILRRVEYRFHRSFLGSPFYYLFSIWAKHIVVARKHAIGRVHWIHIADVALIWTWIPLHIALAAWIGHLHGKSIWASASIAVLIPFMIFSMMLSIAILFHHTHPDVPWYRDIPQWREEHGVINGVVHARMPAPMSWLFLNIMDHNAHHYAPGVPLYRLREMQQALEHKAMSVNRITPWRLWKLSRDCKFFDYGTGRWQDAHGRATTKPLYGSKAESARSCSDEKGGPKPAL
jgi:omega-6 fatty acid desaturase (delta-12 desaturase)